MLTLELQLLRGLLGGAHIGAEILILGVKAGTVMVLKVGSRGLNRRFDLTAVPCVRPGFGVRRLGPDRKLYEAAWAQRGL
jgi:hypothetical protein